MLLRRSGPPELAIAQKPKKLPHAVIAPRRRLGCPSVCGKTHTMERRIGHSSEFADFLIMMPNELMLKSWGRGGDGAGSSPP